MTVPLNKNSRCYHRDVIVDFHTHVFPPRVIAERERYAALDATFRELYGDPKAKLATSEELLASMGAAGIDASVILGFAWNDPAVAVPWPAVSGTLDGRPILSQRDQTNPPLAELVARLRNP